MNPRAVLRVQQRCTLALRRFAAAAPSGAKNVPGSDNKVPINEDHAVGLEKMQIEAAKKGKPVFASNVGMLTGPFGTAENPVRVPSVFNSRVVGCTGGAGDHSHDLLWHEVRAGETVVCMGCGQHFVLQKVENEKWDDGYSRYDGKFGQPPVIHDTYHI